MLNQIKKLIYKISLPLVRLICVYIRTHSVFLVYLIYDGKLWALRESCIRKPNRFKVKLYYSYLSTFGSCIELGAKFDGKPVFPHSFYGIFISHKAHIGKDAVIFHHVTIGSNMTVGSKNQGAPTIGNNAYIGCGAKIIGNCHIGNNCRIGANCIVTKDVPDNSVCVLRGLDVIQKEGKLDNTFIAVNND